MGHPPGNTLTAEQRNDALLLWHYQQMRHTLRPCTVAIGLGTHDLGVAAEAANLYLRGFAPRIVFTGGPNTSRPDAFPRGEATHFAEHAVALGVPESAILRELNARNTGENITFSRDLLTDAGVQVRSVLLVSTPYMERRAYATCRKVWPAVGIVCASARTDLHKYLEAVGDHRLVINSMVGDVQRVIQYPKRGFAEPQPVPEEVRDALQRLITAGFDQRLVA
ncbi:YdcF family protein [Kitasatospora sp. NPDC092286]|uniref:YdcF family protein n=1 Tax=Kitasatospora sp. NPDC092286 TaxID=3364087 RepID=UPI0038107971